MRGTDVDALCRQRGWSRTRLVHEMRTVARQQRLGELPAEDSLKRMIRMWANGSRGLSEFHAGLLTSVFGIPFAIGNQEPPPPSAAGDEDQAAEVKARVERSRARVDTGLVELLEMQTDGLRSLDRRLGAVQLLAQSTAHVEQITSLLRYSLSVVVVRPKAPDSRPLTLGGRRVSQLDGVLCLVTRGLLLAGLCVGHGEVDV